MLMDHQLQGRYVLIAHESAFERFFLSEVIAAAGASIAGPVGSGPDGIVLLDSKSRVDAMVLSQTLLRHDAVALIAAALTGNVRTVVIHPAQSSVHPPFTDHPCLASPYSGFQIVSTLVDVLAATRGCMHWSAGAR